MNDFLRLINGTLAHDCSADRVETSGQDLWFVAQTHLVLDGIEYFLVVVGSVIELRWMCDGYKIKKDKMCCFYINLLTLNLYGTHIIVPSQSSM